MVSEELPKNAVDAETPATWPCRRRWSAHAGQEAAAVGSGPALPPSVPRHWPSWS
ncbi:hypothetical protein ABZ626_38615 [Streptomyces longispororuber]|uniref:hypothetical protein n=1 Tax=Streptomyces longispororuber TaxID=68230 RepID=UPI0033C4A04A